MLPFGWRYKKDREDVAREVRADLENVLNRSGEFGVEFICKEDIKTIWTAARIRKLSQGLSWEAECSLQEVQDEFRVILSILVWIRWDAWSQFRRIFISHPRRADCKLPLDLRGIPLDSHQREFIEQQYIFMPVVLVEEHRYANHDLEYDQRYRMPFLKSEEIGVGAGGVVTKELIAVKYFRSSDTGFGPNTEERWVAKKTIDKGNKTGPNERGNLRLLKQGSRGHENIMQSYTSFTHGTKFVILSPLADLDLNKFLYGKYTGVEHRSLRFTTFDLLKEAATLAHALNFLHFELRLENARQRISCAHLDFKPENILVKWNSDPGWSSVGQWLIADFGISKIKGSAEENESHLRPLGDLLVHFSLTKAQRVPGPYQAPEVQKSQDRVVGRESDMWSFGCLLAAVVSFAVGGPDRVCRLIDSVYNDQLQNQSQTDYFYTFVGRKVVLKPSLIAFLDSLRSNNANDSWIKKTLEVVYNLLQDDPNVRLKAKDACLQLDIIADQEKRRISDRCAWITSETPMERPVAVHISGERRLGAENMSFDSGTHVQSTSREAQLDPRHNLNSGSVDRNLNDGLHVTSQYMSLPLGPPQTLNLPTHPLQYPQQSLYTQSPQHHFSHEPYTPPQSKLQSGFLYPPTSPLQNPGHYVSQNMAYPSSQSSHQQSTQHAIPHTPTTSEWPRNPSAATTVLSNTGSSDVVAASDTHAVSPEPSRSDENSSLAKISSLGIDIAFMHFPTPPNTIKTAVCGASKRIAFLSNLCVKIYNLNIQSYWVTKRPQKPPDQIPRGFFEAQNITPPQGFEWDMISLSGEYLLLRAKTQVEFKFYRYFCHQIVDNGMTLEIWTEAPFYSDFSPSQATGRAQINPNQIASRVLGASINFRGDVLFSLNATLCCYTSALGLHTLDTQGQLRRACFSSDGSHIFAWSLGDVNQQENRWYIWDSSETTTHIMNKPTQRKPAERAGSGKNGLIFPFSRYFAAFEIPNRVYVVGRDPSSLQISQLRSSIDNVIGGSSYESLESQAQGLILIQQHSSPRLINLPFMADTQSSMPLKPKKLREGFYVKTSAVAVTVEELNSSETVTFVSHSSGLVERRRILS